MVRAGGSASRTIGDQSSTDPGGGFRLTKQRNPQWRMPAGRNKGRHWAADSQEFPALVRPPSTVKLFGRSKYHRYGPVAEGSPDAGFPEIGWGNAAGLRNSADSSQAHYRTDTGSHEDYSDATLGFGRELYPQEDIKETIDLSRAHGH